MTTTWSNWSTLVTCIPRAVTTAQTDAEIRTLIHQARRDGLKVRVAGTGHSFTPLCATDGVLLLLAAHPQPLEQPAADTVTFWAGSKIHQLGAPLWACGLSMANMGDIDRQAIGGAIGTGTHGTGPGLGNISTQVVGLRLVTATGELIDCSPTQEAAIFKAAQISLGALGVITQVTLRGLPAYYLHERTWVAEFAECVAQLDDHIAATRHFEFFWSPGEDACAMKALQPVALTAAQAENLPLLVEGVGPGELRGRLARYVRPERIDRAYRIFPSERTLKFNEMEFAVPAANGPDCLCEIRQLMQAKHPHVLWPIEYRTLAADDIPLSPAYGRATVTISIHQAADLPHEAFFADAEAIFRNHQGRPHWGKLHSHTANQLRDLYPQWAAFQTVRRQLDPNGLFRNEHLRVLFDATE